MTLDAEEKEGYTPADITDMLFKALLDHELDTVEMIFSAAIRLKVALGVVVLQALVDSHGEVIREYREEARKDDRYLLNEFVDDLLLYYTKGERVKRYVLSFFIMLVVE